jgi:hypothetical protein
MISGLGAGRGRIRGEDVDADTGDLNRLTSVGSLARGLFREHSRVFVMEYRTMKPQS